MSLRDFWTSIRVGTGFLFPDVTADSPNFDTNQIEARLRSAVIWLTPTTVEGFDENDFPFLPEETRKRLAKYVDEFREAAQKVPPDQPATHQQVQAALPAFLSILEIMRPDKYGDLDAFVIGKQVEQDLKGNLPEWVRELRFESDEDASGDPAIWIWVEISDAAAEKKVFSEHTRQIRSRIADCIRRLEIERWPYVRFRTASERANAGAESKQ